MEQRYDAQFWVVFGASRQRTKPEEMERKEIGDRVEEDGGGIPVTFSD